jgi:hypothetical protein|tara:strand:+ start:48 stop:425 length:378 start_codon:yes stop_codon:yes gene_type:complete
VEKIYDMIGDVHRTVSWKRYLLPTDEPRVIKFLESRGNEVFYQISAAINEAVISNRKSIVLLIHPNIKNVIEIKKKDFITVLDRANEWFISKEKYEVCSVISGYKENVLKKSLKIKNIKHKQSLI